MATNWTVPTVNDLTTVLSLYVQSQSNEQVGDGSAPDMAVDLAQPNRLSECLSKAVSEFRAAIRTGNRVPISETSDSLPPECVRPALNLAAYQMVSAMPSLQMVLLTETNGVYSPLLTFYKEARAMKDSIRRGLVVTIPSDPEDTDVADAQNGGGDYIEGEYDMRIYP